jgi:hypothetical protein
VTTAASIVSESIKLYRERIGVGEEPVIAEQIVQDLMVEKLGPVLIVEEPMCCDALLRTDWLHHSSCPEVQSHHCGHDTKQPDCPACNLQRRAEDRLPD